MAPDPVLVENTRQWLRLAKEDLDNAAHDLAAAPPFLKSALFHCQQAAEKALKGFLTWRDVRFRRVHDLDVIGAQCAEVDASLAELVDRVASLSVYASRFRYPGAPWEPTAEEAAAGCQLAREAVEAVLTRLPDAVRPCGEGGG